MKLIPLTNSKLYAKVDDDDFLYLTKTKWAHKNGYAVTSGSSQIFMHRIILKTPKGLITDHKDHDRLNNQKANIRICTHAQNVMNRRTKPPSGFKGVCLQRGKWASHIKKDGKHIWLGLFSSKEEAAITYDKAAIKYFGEFAKLNFPI